MASTRRPSPKPRARRTKTKAPSFPNHPHVQSAHDYAAAVLSGTLPACKWVRLACRRQLEDLARPFHAEQWPYRFDPDRAERVCRFIELLPHIKGRWKTPLIVLEPWQRFILSCVFGWVDAQGFRRFRQVYEEVPRKNAKSTKMAGVGLYMLAADGEPGPEIYSAATTRDQARIVFNIARLMAKKSPKFCERFGVEVLAHNLDIIETAAFMRPVSSDADSLDGLNPHMAALDELHAHKTRLVYDVFDTATGARAQPLLWNITTAGSNRAGICYEVRRLVVKILEAVELGRSIDETTFGIIYTIDDEDVARWDKEATWRKANPNYGVSVNPADLKRKAAKARQVPSAKNAFLTKHLNVWVNAASAWMDMARWNACAVADLEPRDFAGEDCYLALDLASKRDIASLSLWFPTGPDEGALFGRYYLPQAAVTDSKVAEYAGWAETGKLIVTPGDVTDFGRIEDDADELCRLFNVLEVAYDPYQAVQLSQRCMERGMPMVEMRPTVLNFSEPMKQMEAMAFTGKLHHDGDPVLEWMVSNVVAWLDAKDNIYPRKESEEAKIDGVVSAIMAIGRWMAGRDNGGGGYTREDFATV